MNALVRRPPPADLADPVYAAMERHRQAYDVFMDLWDKTHAGLDLHDRTDPEAKTEALRFRDLETAEGEAFNALLVIKPTTKAGAIACVAHVADCGLATDEMRAWLAMLLESPLVS